MWTTYIIIALLLLAAELVYFKIADHFNIIDRPNERSSHKRIVLRGGGVIFAISMIIWLIWQMVNGEWGIVQGYLPFMCGLILICGVSLWDDVKSLPDSVRLVVQFAAMGLAIYPCIIAVPYQGTLKVVLFLIALIFFVGATNIINFMDGINGITAGYALAMLIPLLLLDVRGQMDDVAGFIEPSYLIVAIIGVLVFSIFNFRPKGKAKCFAGDVGSIGIAFIILFAMGRLIIQTGDLTYLILILIYGVDGVLTICHRIMLHENLGQAHRKHAYQLMCNELKIGHVKISLLYMVLQLAVSLGFIYLIPNTTAAHWIYLLCMCVVFAIAYVAFKMKYYYLHENYLKSLEHESHGSHEYSENIEKNEMDEN